ncbi:SUMF1/EgtB/PvdO family nonheme iron enzyme [Azospirillum sp. sgz302134]
MRTALILTAIDVETRHILPHLADTIRDDDHPGQVFRVGRFRDGNGRDWKVVVAEERGNEMAAVNATMAIMKFNPDIALFVGVAGGLKDAQMGDAVVSTKIYGYEPGKTTKHSFLARPDAYRPDQKLVSLARDLARSEDWKRRRLYRDPYDKRRIHFGPIAAGNKVIASHEAELVTFLHDHYNDALAVETEGLGFAAAAHAMGNAPWLVIRGISDRLTGKNEAEAQASQEKAIDNAAAFAFQLLYELPDNRGRAGGSPKADGPFGHADRHEAFNAEHPESEPVEPGTRQRWWADRLGLAPLFPLEVPELGITIPMAVIPPGTFTMGSRNKPEEFPPQTITIPHAFAIGCTAVPNWLFARWQPEACTAHPDLPAVNVDWHRAVAFAAWLSQAAAYRVRLPSEAEWEYAAQAGSDNDFWCGGQPLGDFNLGSAGRPGAPQGRVHTVDSGVPNPWGLRHVHGNVWEWVADGWRSSLHSQPENGAAWTGDPTDRVIKGGSCRDHAGKARSASRQGRDPSRPSDIIGFRIAMDLRWIR